MTSKDVEALRSRLCEPVSDLKTAAEPKDVTELTTFYNKLCQDNLGKSLVCIVPLNKTAKAFNNAMMKEQNITEVTSHAIDSGGHAEAAKKKRGRPQKDGSENDEQERETAAILKTFVFGVGARVMLRRNISVNEGLVNGTVSKYFLQRKFANLFSFPFKIGTVKEIVYNNRNQPHVALVLFDGHTNTTAIERMHVTFPANQRKLRGMRKQQLFTVSRFQFPLSLAYAISCHKSQGMFFTLDFNN